VAAQVATIGHGQAQVLNLASERVDKIGLLAHCHLILNELPLPGPPSSWTVATRALLAYRQVRGIGCFNTPGSDQPLISWPRQSRTRLLWRRLPTPTDLPLDHPFQGCFPAGTTRSLLRHQGRRMAGIKAVENLFPTRACGHFAPGNVMRVLGRLRPDGRNRLLVCWPSCFFSPGGQCFFGAIVTIVFNSGSPA
jgi:hypothetical protein